MSISLRIVSYKLGLSNRLLITMLKRTKRQATASFSASATNIPDLNDYHKSQTGQLDDQCILVNENDQIIGTASKKDCHLSGAAANDGSTTTAGGLLHRAFSVLLFNTKNELLLQQRSSLKITYPLHYTNTCCSHPRANEAEMNEVENAGIKVAAQRRMNFELGIPEDQLPLSDIHFLTRINYNSPAGQGWAENELDHVCFIQKDVDIQLNYDEVADARYLNQDSLCEFMLNADKKGILITPWFQWIYTTFLDKWWNHLAKGQSELLELKTDKIWRAGFIGSTTSSMQYPDAIKCCQQ
eukprot:gene3009-3467_t